MNLLDIFGVHTIVLHQMKRTPYGDEAGEGVSVQGCFVTEKPALVRNTNGEEVVSSAHVATPVGVVTTLDNQPRITLPSGRTGRVISISRAEGAPIGLPEHDVLYLD
ncbi:hypothetical protein [Schaalia sp. lx-100]|uniref:hypothetical protein n=1 Tax=Schaalia sp. lx-100 TaxID=2899081 RepID=UPI001E5F4F25|nr:hypothetical protein [Schaalia sp. lx-100]MCD4558228.1 hypothetical protein [Schaalia sp. lx-100]